MTEHCHICNRAISENDKKKCIKCHKYTCSNCSIKHVEFNQICLTDVVIRVCKNCKNK